MSNFGVGLFLVGVLTGLIGVGGFFDTRKVDRRFKTGYKNNEPDNRNFGRAGKRILYGIGVCIVASAIISLSSPSERTLPTTQVDNVASQPEVVAASQAEVSNPVVALDPQQAGQKSDSGVALGSNERVVAPESVAPALASELVPVAQVQDASLQSGQESASCTEDGTFFGANICKSATLAAAYDRELKEYEAAQGRIGGKDIGVRIEQQNWLDQVTKSCSDMTCLTEAFDARTANLHSRYRKDG
ncbi:hypothetical protein DSC91_007384 [Paraburkholderia caffeinilytica]|uniref:Lysozyme inhibitor LprI N-terminal domain-containing protein n=1 Tax=Paraburkholderia caffeinilytica TaxID=1761016 RepID=A0ABQ1N9Z2_9BURK|nr:hypothetical protein [Paraburkholderia caffeinilytica]AXL53772.1 hypothetical protein DSC91_007384 [Paraburkholderia caffeinilytica]GGC63554.1 hypothetical protein GCM10011400_59230 [Paraburkholderia caffeinilytica]CAB3799835.1 hypothetical protein LMG28690_05019 [Paraburkholderia caffeinilytica]